MELSGRDYITVVSGVPRSGTSLMMRMLDAGGIPALTDGIRQPDEHNPHGYFEYEPVKRLARDSSWMGAARGKAVKIVHWLLNDLPAGFEYRVVFLDRDLGEVFESQRRMLMARGDEAANQDEKRIVAALAAEVRGVKESLAGRRDATLLNVPYAGLVGEPAKWTREVSQFLDHLDEAAMTNIVDPLLYRQRRVTHW